MIRCIAMDLDDTLLSTDLTISVRKSSCDPESGSSRN